MSSTEYASAVAAVKAMESSLLTHSDIEQLINAGSASDFSALISSKAGEEQTLAQIWDMLSEFAPGCRELEILLYRNDFHNFKAALKALLSNRDASQYYIEPTNLDLSILTEVISSKSYDDLPEYMRDTAAEAYELLTETLDGQLSDTLIDAAALRAMQNAAEKTGSSFMVRYAQLTTVCADIKTAYRCSLMGKSRLFLETAVCGSSELDKESLVRAAQSGTDALFTFLDSTAYGDLGTLLKESPAQFEKRCDDMIMEHAESARLQAFGFEPLAAYFIAKEAEIKNIRILTVCREYGADRETITERMRKLYV